MNEEYQSLKAEKKSLKNDKFHLQLEVSRLNKQLETASISSHSSLLSRYKGLSHSCSSLLERDLVDVSLTKVRKKKHMIIIQTNNVV